MENDIFTTDSASDDAARAEFPSAEPSSQGDSSQKASSPKTSFPGASSSETASQEQAWADQQRASAAYAGEAERNSYPGSSTGGAPLDPGPQYPGWSQYSTNGQPYRLQPVRPTVKYRTGTSVATVVWGALLLLGAIGLLLTTLSFNGLFAKTYTVMAIVSICGLLGLIIIIAGIVAVVKGERQGDDDDEGNYDAGGDGYDSYYDADVNGAVNGENR